MTDARSRGRYERGAILLAALLVLVIVSALAAALFASADAEMRQARTHRVRTEISELAEAATIAAEQEVMRALGNSLAPPTTGSLQFGPQPVPWTAMHVGQDQTSTDGDGVTTTHRRYTIAAAAALDGHVKTLHRGIDVGLTPLFQYSVFYDSDLEMLPRQTMTLTGRIHTNGDLYVGNAAGKTLELDTTYVRCCGSLFHQRKDDGSPTVGKVKTRKAGTNTFYDFETQAQLTALGIPSASGYDSAFTGWDANHDGDLTDSGDWADFAVGALTRWNGTVKTGAHGMPRIEVPPVGSIARFEPLVAGMGDHAWDAAQNDYVFVGAGLGDHRKGLFHQNAALVVRDLSAFDKDGQSITLPPGTLAQVSFYDAREGKTVNCTEIDIAKLNGSGRFPANGLLYASRSDTTSAQPNGIRLKNGAALAGPLTVVTEDPLYVKGDYNTSSKKPAAVLCDAFNLLSNSWNDTKTKGGVLPVATDTYGNLAIVAGSDATVAGQYGGGLDNLVRFHEDWLKTVRKCVLKGAFVCLWAPQFASGAWAVGGDRYTDPGRIWGYETAFDNASSLPPFTPFVAQVKSVGFWE